MEEKIINLECLETKRMWRLQLDAPYDATAPYGNNLSNYKFELFIETLLVDKTTKEVIRRDVNPQAFQVPCTALDVVQPGMLQNLLQVLGYFLTQSELEQLSAVEQPSA